MNIENKEPSEHSKIILNALKQTSSNELEKTLIRTEKSYDASLASACLKQRASSTPCAKALKNLNIKWPTSTMISIE